jgi:hypothetical protein
MTLEAAAWIAGIALVPITVFGWIFTGRKKTINKSKSRDGIAISGLNAGDNSLVTVHNSTSVANGRQ